MIGSIMLGVRATPAERPLLIAAAEQLSAALTDSGEPGWPVTLRSVADANPPPPIVIATMRAALDGAEDEAGLRDRLAGLIDRGACTLLLCTLVRFVADPARRAALMPRIRALNLAAVELSHDLGLAVIDLDRTVSLFGAGPLATDYRLGGAAAAVVAGHGIVSALLAGGLDADAPFDRQQRAIARHGDMRHLAKTLERRLQAPATRAMIAP